MKAVDLKAPEKKHGLTGYSKFFVTQNFYWKYANIVTLHYVECYLHILVYILNIHYSKSAQVGHLHRPSRYAAFYTF